MLNFVKTFSALSKMIMWVLSLILLICCTVFTSLHMLIILASLE
jgi:hypothetical protein